MPSVRVRDNESFEKALRRFSKACEKTGLLSEIKKRQHFEKPRERRKRKLDAARAANSAGCGWKINDGRHNASRNLTGAAQKD